MGHTKSPEGHEVDRGARAQGRQAVLPLLPCWLEAYQSSRLSCVMADSFGERALCLQVISEAWPDSSSKEKFKCFLGG